MADSDTKSKQREGSRQPDRGRQRDKQESIRLEAEGKLVRSGQRRTPRPRQVVNGPRRRTGGMSAGDPLEQSFNAPSAAQPTPQTGPLISTGSGPYDETADNDNNPVNRAQRQSAAEKEAGASTSDGQQTRQLGEESRLAANQSDENADSEDQESGRKGGKKKAKAKISRSKKIIISLVIGVLGIGGVGVSTLSGPLKLVHFAQFLQTHFRSHEFFTDDRASRFTTFRRLTQGGTVQSTRLGTVAGKYADRWDKRLERRSGVRPVYDKTTGRMVGFEITDPDKASNVVKDFEDSGVNIKDPDGNLTVGRTGGDIPEGRIIDLSDSSARKRRAAIRSVVDGLDINKVSSAMGSRVLIRLGGVDFHPLKNIKRRAGEKFVDFYRRKLEQHRKRIKTGTDGPNANRLEPDNRTDPDGNPIGDPDAGSIADGANAELDEAIEAGKSGKLKNFKNSFAGKLAGGAVAAIGAICLVRDLGNQAEELRYTNTILPMMRLGFEYMSIGAQIFAFQDLNFDELNYYISRLYDVEKDLPHVAAASIQFENGLEPSGPDISAAVKPDEANGKPLIFRVIDSIPGIGAGCFIADGSFISKIPIAGRIYDAANSLQDRIINGTLKATIGIDLNDLVGAVVGWLAGEAVDTLATGADLGNYANYGARLAANTQSLASGGRELNGIETAQLKENERLLIAEEKQHMSLTERYFSMETPDSLSRFAVANIAGGSRSFAHTLLGAPTTLFSSLLPKASAQTTYDYGFNKVSFSVDEASSTVIEDPFENAEYVEANFDALNGEYGKCFPTKMSVANGETVLAVGSYTDPELVNQFENDDMCNDPSNEDLLRFRAYLADTMVAKSLNCYEGDEAACNEISFNGSGGTTGAGVFEGEIDDRMADTTNMTCAPLGLQGERNNVDIFGPNNIKLCNYGSNVWVNASWSATISAMFADARAAGIDVGGGAWRSYDSQVALYQKNCGGGTRTCNPPTARPGSSNHEYGLAIDFSHITSTCGVARGITTCTRSATYNWLVANAARYGVKKLNSEAWHWSHNGN